MKQKKKSRSRSQKHQAPRKKYTGRVQKNPRGFAFLLCSDKSVPDTFVPKNAAEELLEGDRVEYLIHREGRRTVAEITRIVQRSRTRVVGRYRTDGRYPYVETALNERFFVDKAQRILPNDWVIARITEYPKQRRLGEVEIEERLGAHLMPKHDYPIIISQWNLPEEFSGHALDDAQEACDRSEREFEGKKTHRKDQRHVPYVTIDGEDAKDFDDAIFVEIPKEGPAAYILYVAIADVSFFVRPGTALDKEALERGTSVYLPGTVLPMLPEILSNQYCSLRPQEDKLALVAEIHYDRSGEVIHTKFYSSMIKTAGRLTYNEVQAFFDKKSDKWAKLATPLNHAHQLYKLLLKKRKERGVLDFDLPESRVEIDRDGVPTRCYRPERLDSHKLIEEFMIAANQAVARGIREGKRHTLHRVHEAPDPRSIEDLNFLMQSLGINKQLKGAAPRDFSKLLAETAGEKAARTLHQAILRSQRQARYEPEPKGHFGLALRDYAHFTSPIRRYPDLLVHRALKGLISSSHDSEKNKEGVESLAILGERTSDSERRAMEAERFAVKRKHCWFMKERLGERFSGIISGVIQSGLFVEIPEFGIEGFVPVDGLAQVYEFDEGRNCFRRRPGHSVLQVGDPLEIQVSQVNIPDNEITFVEEDRA